MDNANVIESTATPVGGLTLSGVMRIPAVRQILLLIGLAGAVAAGFALFVWSQTPGYTPLFSDLAAGDTGQVSESLRAADIPFRIDTDTGTVLVPQSRIHDARLELAGQGGGRAAALIGMHPLQMVAPPRLAFVSTRQRATASTTGCGTWVPAGLSRHTGEPAASAGN